MLFATLRNLVFGPRSLLRPTRKRRPGVSHARPSRHGAQVHLEQLQDRCLLSLTTGPLALISNPDPLANLPPGPRGAGVMTEPYVTVNPANPKNMAAIWIDDGYAGNVAGVTFDGGQTWQNVAIPGLTLDTGGSNQTVADPWISFAPNGDLYSSGISFPGPKALGRFSSTSPRMAA
jgi:hypothetical protein